ncbi:MAG: hypothetical protein US70_C0008G0015 [Parcubacteria group bacterium GW2011_GWD2_38_11]|nr:MAG: hypothetical protein US70_C0008G0015 [Parcubacteria group bacterium GW2011_GWD2_38_11]
MKNSVVLREEGFMQYFKNLANKWTVTIAEKKEMESLRIFVKLVASKSPYKGKDARTIRHCQEEIEAAKEARRKISKIINGIWARRKEAIFGG